jgi:hypothetical protein
LDKLYRKHLIVWAISWCAFIVGMIVLAKLTTEPMAVSRLWLTDFI